MTSLKILPPPQSKITEIFIHILQNLTPERMDGEGGSKCDFERPKFNLLPKTAGQLTVDRAKVNDSLDRIVHHLNDVIAGKTLSKRPSGAASLFQMILGEIDKIPGKATTEPSAPANKCKVSECVPPPFLNEAKARSRSLTPSMMNVTDRKAEPPPRSRVSSRSVPPKSCLKKSLGTGIQAGTISKLKSQDNLGRHNFVRFAEDTKGVPRMPKFNINCPASVGSNYTDINGRHFGFSGI